MKDKINVLQLVEGFSLGGAEKKLMELVRCMDRDRFQTVVCSLGLGDEIQEEFEALQDLGIRVLVEPRRHRVDFGLLKRVTRLMREAEIDVAMTTLFYADVLGPFAGISLPRQLLCARWRCRKCAGINTKICFPSDALPPGVL